MSANSTALNGRSRPRAKRACKTCNARRVKCNVTEEQPCTNCRNTGSACELKASRRGKCGSPFLQRSLHNTDALQSRYDRHPSFSRVLSEPKSSSNTPPRQHHGVDSEQTTLEDQPRNGMYNRSESMSQAPGNANIESLAGGTPVFHITPPSTTYLDAISNGADSTVFLGESNSISLVHAPQTSSAASHSSPADKTRLRYPIPDAVSIRTSTFESRRKAARIEYLTKEGVFSFPSSEVYEVLLGAYFEWFHPCFPILDRYRFFSSYIAKSISPLLLHSVLFVGATHCNENVMRRLGYHDRQEARNEMYNHAKDLYDADYETDKVTVSQALFLMSFWRAGPLLEKDTRHWLGAAISLAQTKGMHRS
jgi:hypothetical protein